MPRAVLNRVIGVFELKCRASGVKNDFGLRLIGLFAHFVGGVNRKPLSPYLVLLPLMLISELWKTLCLFAVCLL